MNIIETAIRIEKEGEKYYRELAEQTNSQGLRKIFTLLADDEVIHRKIFEKLKKKTEIELNDSGLLVEASVLFKGMSEQEKNLQESDQQEAAYQTALKHEQKSIEIYQGLLEQTSSDLEIEVIEKVIAEEKKHAFLIENMIDFIRQPKYWLENAEFRQLEDY